MAAQTSITMYGNIMSKKNVITTSTTTIAQTTTIMTPAVNSVTTTTASPATTVTTSTSRTPVSAILTTSQCTTTAASQNASPRMSPKIMEDGIEAQYAETMDSIASQRSYEFSQDGTHHGLEYGMNNPKKRTRHTTSPSATPTEILKILETSPEKSLQNNNLASIQGMFTTIMANHTTTMDAITSLTRKVEEMENHSKQNKQHDDRLALLESKTEQMIISTLEPNRSHKLR